VRCTRRRLFGAVAPFRLAATWLSIVAVWAPMKTASGQDRIRDLPLSQPTRISASSADLTSIGAAVVTPWGELAMTQPSDQQIVFVGESTLTRFGRRGEGPGEFRNPARIGIVGDSLWVSDIDLHRVSVIAVTHTPAATRPFAFPPAGADSRDTLMASVRAAYPWALYSDGSSLAVAVIGGSPERPSWAPASRVNQTPVVRIGRDGSFQRVVTWLPNSGCIQNVKVRNGSTSINIPIPFCARPVWDIAKDGSRVAMATALGDSAFRLVVVSAQGDTVLDKAVRSPAQAVPHRALDSTRNARIAAMPFPEAAEAYRRMDLPKTYPPVGQVICGQDGAVWAQIPDAEGRPSWLSIDRQGRIGGRIVLDPNVTLLAVTSNSVWAAESDADGLPGILRFRRLP
jgi:hypothetical protein